MLMRLYHSRFNEQIETADARDDLVAVAVMITSLPDIRSSAAERMPARPVQHRRPIVPDGLFASCRGP